MEKIKVWTKQNEAVLRLLRETGRYTARKQYIDGYIESVLTRESYDWMVANHPAKALKPADADYPIWLSFEKRNTMNITPGTVLLELELDSALITRVNVSKWGTILNRTYLPMNGEDAARHRELMRAYRISDATACTTQFYPQLRREIESSWLRLFDDSVSLGSDYSYGTVWELKREWLTDEQ